MAITESEPTLYFGYGSNLWLDQMARRCPESKYIGIALLKDWRWIITIRGYANVVPSPGDIVYGLVYELSEADEASLDVYEGVPHCYVKELIPVDFIPKKTSTGEQHSGSTESRQTLVYVDFKRVSESRPKEEYIHRMNMGITDAWQEGMPSDYIDKYLRPFIPAPDSSI